MPAVVLVISIVGIKDVDPRGKGRKVNPMEK